MPGRWIREKWLREKMAAIFCAQSAYIGRWKYMSFSDAQTTRHVRSGRKKAQSHDQGRRAGASQGTAARSGCKDPDGEAPVGRARSLSKAVARFRAPVTGLLIPAPGSGDSHLESRLKRSRRGFAPGCLESRFVPQRTFLERYSVSSSIFSRLSSVLPTGTKRVHSPEARQRGIHWE
jgi:hypothetical protein